MVSVVLSLGAQLVGSPRKGSFLRTWMWLLALVWPTWNLVYWDRRTAGGKTGWCRLYPVPTTVTLWYGLGPNNWKYWMDEGVATLCELCNYYGYWINLVYDSYSMIAIVLILCYYIVLTLCERLNTWICNGWTTLWTIIWYIIYAWPYYCILIVNGWTLMPFITLSVHCCGPYLLPLLLCMWYLTLVYCTIVCLPVENVRSYAIVMLLWQYGLLWSFQYYWTTGEERIVLTTGLLFMTYPDIVDLGYLAKRKAWQLSADMEKYIMGPILSQYPGQ